MGVIQLLGSTMGLGLVSGMNLYATVLTVGLGIRLGLIHLRPELNQLEILANPYVLLVAGSIFLIEFLADKIKWVDSLWDAVHTLIRPLGAAVIGVTAVGKATPEAVIIALLCGGVALSGHSTKAGLRLVANHSPEPFSNVALSLVEDGLVIFGSWLALQYPAVMLVVVLVFVMVFAWFTPKVFRLLRVESVAILSIIKKVCVILRRYGALGMRRLRGRASDLNPARAHTSSSKATTLDGFPSDEMPVNYKYHVKDEFAMDGQYPRIRCVAGKGMRGLRHSIGYLHVAPDQLLFVTRRLFRFRAYTIPTPSVGDVHFKKNLLMDRLSLRADQKAYVFYFFKHASLRNETVRNFLQSSPRTGA